MKRFFYSFIALMLMLCASVSANAVTITKTTGWFEAGAVEWTWESGATYTVSISSDNGSTWTKLDQELVRQYSTYGRADAVGLKAGSYMFKVTSSASGDATTSFTAVAYDRSGFAHYNRSDGVGAYNNDGTLKTNARVLYVTAVNAKTVSLDMMVSSSKKETRTGLQEIIDAYQKSAETRPLDVRIIGTIKAADMDEFGSSSEGLQVKGGGSGKCNAQLTIEGVGEDACIHGFGILCRSISSVEFRNFGIMICMDDCLSLDTDNKNIWIHNMDFFYGGTGSDADQAKGDGTVDIKGKSSQITVSYNHFYDSGKCSLGGMKSETTDCWMTYHHNWFDHSDSRHPRIRTAFYHVYNNYFDGNAKYGVGVTMGGSSFVEANYFRNCKYPMLSSKQGTDAQGDGTFSGENGGVIKAYNNLCMNPKQVLYYDGKQTDGVWDAVKVDSRNATVSATAFTGGTSYNNDATTAAIKAVPTVDDPSTIPATVRGDLGAGRMNHGDFKWSFNNAVQDPNYAVITELKSALVNYKSTLVAYGDGTAALNAGATETVDDGDGKGIDQEKNDAVVPQWGAGGDSQEESDFEEESYIESADEDMFWFGENEATTNQYVAGQVITIAASDAGTASKWDNAFYTTTTTKGVTYTSDHVGAFNLAKASSASKYDGGSIIFYCPNGVTTFKFNGLRSGTGIYQISKSTDGTNYTAVATVTDQKAGVFTKDVSSVIRDTESADPVWVKITNGSTGSLYVFGVQIRQLASGSSTLTAPDLAVVTSEKALYIGETYTLAKGTDYTTSSTGTISYSSNKTSVATVSSDGKITALAEGTATITIAQAKDDTYKAGTATMTVTVTDPRAASSFELTSAAEVSLKEGETSQITTTGAAGTVTYTSDKTSIATVDANGKISAVAAGSATITVNDPGTANVKGSSYTVTVAVTKDMTDAEICYFTASTKSPSLSNVSVSGNYSNSKGSVTYNGTTYSDCVKMESSTSITITPASDCKITLIFGGSTSAAGKKISLGGTTITLDANGQYTFCAKGGTTYTLKKSDSINLFLIVFSPYPSVTLNDAGYATYSSDVDVDINAEGVETYTAKVSGSKIVLTKATNSYIPAGVGVLLYGGSAMAQQKVTFKTKTNTAAIAANDLKATTTATTAIVAKPTTGYTFALGAEDTFLQYSGDNFIANRAYINLTSDPTSGAKEMTIVFADDATGINAVNANYNNVTDACYNLAGQRVSANAKGIVIRNGRKYINK